MTHVFSDGVVWTPPSNSFATITRNNCYAESVPISGPLTEDQARELLDATPGVGIYSPEGLSRERELIRFGGGPDGDGKFLGWSW